MSALLAAIETAAALDPSAVALRAGREVVPFRSLLDDVARRADGLRRAGVARGEVVLGEIGRPIDALVAALAAVRAGAVPCLLPDATPAPPGIAWRWRDLDAPPERVAEGPRLDLPAGTAWLRPTGGTTGGGRLVAISDAQATAAAVRAGDSLSAGPGTSVAVTLVPATGYGWNSTVGPLVRGGAVVFVPSVAPRGLLDALARGASLGVTTPPVVRALARLPSHGIRREARVFVAGSAYPSEDARRAEATHGLRFLDRYGSTEVGVVAQAKEPGGPLVAAPGLSVRAVGDPAVLEVRGDSVAIGYAVEPGRPRLPPFDGAFRTADLVAFSPDGSFRLLGRGDRVVKRMGRAVDLAAVERVVARIPGVLLARVQAVPGHLDVDLVAKVVGRAGIVLVPERVLAAAAPLLPSWERPSRVEVVDRAPAAGAEKWASAESDA